MVKYRIVQKEPSSFWSILFQLVILIAFIIKVIKPLIPSKKSIHFWSIKGNLQLAKWIIDNNYRSKSIISFSGRVNGKASLIVKESGKTINTINLKCGRNNFTFEIFDEGIYTFYINIVGTVSDCNLELNKGLKT